MLDNKYNFFNIESNIEKYLIDIKDKKNYSNKYIELRLISYCDSVKQELNFKFYNFMKDSKLNVKEIKSMEKSIKINIDEYKLDLNINIVEFDCDSLNKMKNQIEEAIRQLQEYKRNTSSIPIIEIIAMEHNCKGINQECKNKIAADILQALYLIFRDLQSKDSFKKECIQIVSSLSKANGNLNKYKNELLNKIDNEVKIKEEEIKEKVMDKMIDNTKKYLLNILDIYKNAQYVIEKCLIKNQEGEIYYIENHERQDLKNINEIEAIIEETSQEEFISKETLVIEDVRLENDEKVEKNVIEVEDKKENELNLNSLDKLQLERVILQAKVKEDSIKKIIQLIPGLKVIQHIDGEYLIEAEVIEDGIKESILSQGKNIEVIKPDSLRNDIKEIIMQMFKNYSSY